MEETMGKRIVANRKRLGITQDRLAEQLGVTAQAVSKWENDQSCPDITMIPKLAELFGISADELLGMEKKEQKQETVFAGEIVEAKPENDKHENDGLHFQNGLWELRWDAGKKNSVGLAVWVLLVGGLMLASSLCIWNVGMWDILWPSGLVVFGLFGLFPKFSFFRLGCGLFGAYFLLNNLNVMPFDLDKGILLPVFLLLFGLSLLVDAMRKPSRSRFSVRHNGKEVTGEDGRHRSFCDVEGERFQCSMAFGEDTHYIHLPRLCSGTADVSFGELTVDLSGCETVAEDCRVEVNCSFGQLNLLVPSRYRVEADTSTAFASMEYEGRPDTAPQGVINLTANASFGEISVQYI